MQKQIGWVLMILCTPMAWAFDGISGKALSALLQSDYAIQDYEDNIKPVSEVLSPWFLSKFDDDGNGVLQTATQVCTQQHKQYQCTLNLYSADMQQKSDGSYQAPSDATESSMRIEYDVDLNFKKVLQPPKVFYAG